MQYNADKANRTLGFLRRNLYQCPQEEAYKGCSPGFIFFLEYGSCVWDPQGRTLQEEIEKVQNTAARFVTSNYCLKLGVRMEHWKN